ncbi:hypothetical protein CAI21_22395 [Alkalilimnicola ehrlichii]|uniref:hypothetical protein n=1 Tax=Alkalilimnicola ehrlichii TaxID=351052 RepID=UPI000E2F849F|nr:hypothetical protein [Alkalilimnicola ehrlichii]RFA24247.1 hypothetical protein CAI21_22395 [Alkalilimnicola ehrlichii]
MSHIPLDTRRHGPLTIPPTAKHAMINGDTGQVRKDSQNLNKITPFLSNSRFKSGNQIGIRHQAPYKNKQRCKRSAQRKALKSAADR